MRRITVIASPRALHQVTHQAAMTEGLRRHGFEVLADSGDRATTHLVACWGWRCGRIMRARGHEVLVMERGYIGDRFAWTSLAWNGLNNRGSVFTPDDGSRLSRYHADRLHPVDHSGSYVLIAGQVPGDMSLRGRDLKPWYAEQVKKDWGLPVKFRPHPLAHKRGPVHLVKGAQTHIGPLDEALRDAAVVVTYNSNTGVDAVLAGKKATADDDGSMIWGMKDRQKWAERLAWRQWKLDEIKDGSAWEVVNHGR